MGTSMTITGAGLAALIGASLGAGLGAGLATGAVAGPLDGRWAIRGSRTILRLAPCGDASCGVLETSAQIQADPDARDTRNPDPRLRTRRVKGIVTLQDLRPSGASRWDGRTYLPDHGATYRVTVTQVDADTVHARGCAAPFLCQTATLTRLP